MSADGRALLDDGVTVYTGPVAEGTKWLKRDGWYYLIIPEGGVGQGWQTVLRSKNIYGPYEKKVVLEKGSTIVNGPHQGALVDTPDGNWWFFHFQETPVLGRVVHLQPARWKDGWPMIGVDIDGNGIGEPVMVWTKPFDTQTEPSLPSTNDDFSSNALGLQWQWCHNPDNDFWSLNERKGWFAIKAQASDNLRNARNMLTQKTMGFVSEATTMLDCKQLGKDAFAGLLCIGRSFRGIGVCRDGICLEKDGERKVLVDKVPSKVWLRVSLDMVTNKHQFSYSTDGKRFSPVGDAFDMRSGFWKGIRIGLFCYGNSGTALFDFFNYDIYR